MELKKVKLSAVILFSLALNGLQAQQTIPSSGGDASGSGGSVSYSIGQMVYTTNTGTNGSVAQGVQQPFEISVVTSVDEAKDITLQCTAYPNPATDLLTLKIDASAKLSIQSLSYQLFDVSGKLLETKKVEGSETSIAMGSLVPATYFLKVIQNNKEIKTFKIIKK
jgi:hypothetical protein